VIAQAIASVREQEHSNWELLIVDDGSADGTASVVEQFRDDPRIRLFVEPHRGVSAARNRALRAARGEFVAYLDSDNSWFPHFLSRTVAVLQSHAEVDSIYAAQLVEDSKNGESYVRSTPFDREQFFRDGGVDLNVFVHRRRLFEELGGFDESMTRLVDWDLIGRYSERSTPVLIPIIGGRYVERRFDSISVNESLRHNRALLRQHQQRLAVRSTPHPLRVLWAVWNYPQLTETYIRCELAAMQRWGVEVAVWSEIVDTKSPYAADVPVHHGSLEEAIARVRPDVVHVHWLNKGKDYRDVVVRAGLPMTVRGHSYEFATKSVKKLLNDKAIRSIYLFPHFAKQFAARQEPRPPASRIASPKIQPMTSAFNEKWFSPTTNKDRRRDSNRFSKSRVVVLTIASFWFWACCRILMITLNNSWHTIADSVHRSKFAATFPTKSLPR
jgi:glycosyltransferase involved in cell wall biosynthesis